MNLKRREFLNIIFDTSAVAVIAPQTLFAAKNPLFKELKRGGLNARLAVELIDKVKYTSVRERLFHLLFNKSG